MATYGLVKYTQFVDDFVTWMEETPPIISSEISSDVNQLLQAALVDWNGCFQKKKKKKRQSWGSGDIRKLKLKYKIQCGDNELRAGIDLSAQPGQ